MYCKTLHEALRYIDGLGESDVTTLFGPLPVSSLKDFFWAASELIDAATECIFILDWWTSPEL